jgi:hypothetical protein
MTAELGTAIALVAVAALALALSFTQWAAARLRFRTRRFKGLLAEPRGDDLAELTWMLVWRARGRWLGALVGAAAGFPLFVADTAIRETPVPALAFFGAAWAGSKLGGAIASLLMQRHLWTRRPPASAPSRVTVDDLIDPLDRKNILGVLVVSAALSSAYLVLELTTSLFWDLPALLGPIIAVLACLAVGATWLSRARSWADRRPVEPGVSTPSDLRLQWNDALRSLAIRDVLAATMILGGYAIVSATLGILSALPAFVEIAPTLANEVFVGALLLSFGYVWYLTLERPVAQRYLHRLWPEIAEENERLQREAQEAEGYDNGINAAM